MGNYTVTENVKITNYKPTPGREKNKGDIEIRNDENGKFKVDNKRHENLLNKLQGLDGDNSSISWKDLSLAKSLAGQDKIQKVYLDANAKVVRFVFDDSTDFRVDMGVNNTPALKSIKEEIASGNAKYASGIFNYIMQCITPHTPLKGAEIVLQKLPKENMTLGDVKAHYNLPDGCLRNNIPMGGGNFDSYEATTPLYIHVGTLAKGLGIPEDQIEALFNLK